MRSPSGKHMCLHRESFHWVSTAELVAEVYCTSVVLDEDQVKDALIAAFVLGDVLDDPQFRRKAMDFLIFKCPEWDNIFSFPTLGDVWKKTPPDSPLRRYVIQHIVNKLNRTEFARDIALFPVELTQELAIATIKQCKILSDKESVKSLQAMFYPDKITV